MNQAKQKDALFRFVRNIGLNIRFGDEISYHAQDRTITIDSDSLLYLSNLAHEVGHFLIAPKSRKNKNDYGIPPKKLNCSRAHWDLDDIRAQYVEDYILRYFGLKSKNTRFIIVSDGDKKLRARARKWFRREGKEMINEMINEAIQSEY